MLKNLFGIVFAFTAFTCVAQVNVSNYFNNNVFDQQSATSFQRLDFKWEMPASVQVEMNEGINSLDEQNFYAAIEHFDSVIVLNIKFAPAFYYRGVAYKIINQLGPAEFSLNYASSLLPNRPEIFIELGDVKFLRRDYEKAKEFYEKALEVDKNCAAAYFKLGTLSSSQGKVNEAINHFNHCKKINPKFPNPYLAIAILKLRSNLKASKTAEYFSEAIRADSSYALAYFWRGLNYIRLKDSTKCLEDWNRAVELQPANSTFTTMRGMLHLEMKNYDDAYRDIRKTIASHQVDEKWARFQNTNLDRQIDAQNIINYIARHGQGLAPESFLGVKKAFCMMTSSRFEDALKAINKAQKIETSSVVYYVKGIVFENIHAKDSAFIYYNKVLTLDEGMFDAHKKLALLNYQLGDWRKSYFHLTKMNKIQPGSLVNHRLGALIKIGLKDFYGAIIDASRYLKLDTSDVEILNTRALARMEVGDFKGSNGDITKSLQINPRQPIVCGVFGANLLHLNDTTQAIHYRKECEKKFPSNLTIKLSLADTYVESKDLNQAEAELKLITSLWNYKFLGSYYYSAEFINCKLLVKKGKYKEGLKSINALLEKIKNDEFIFFRAKLLIKMNQPDSAIIDLKTLRERKFKGANDFYQKFGIPTL